MTMKEEKALEQFAWQIRCGIVEAIAAKGGGHIGFGGAFCGLVRWHYAYTPGRA